VLLTYGGSLNTESLSYWFPDVPRIFPDNPSQTLIRVFFASRPNASFSFPSEQRCSFFSRLSMMHFVAFRAFTSSFQFHFCRRMVRLPVFHSPCHKPFFNVSVSFGSWRGDPTGTKPATRWSFVSYRLGSLVLNYPFPKSNWNSARGEIARLLCMCRLRRL
jgi:hypothetical protein